MVGSPHCLGHVAARGHARCPGLDHGRALAWTLTSCRAFRRRTGPCAFCMWPLLGRGGSRGSWMAFRGMAGIRKPQRCRICRKRPPWRYQNCPPGICKRCYHRHVWDGRPAAQGNGRAAGRGRVRSLQECPRGLRWLAV